MAGRKARHAANTRNTSCLARATQTSSPPKTTMRSRKKPVPCGPNNRFLLPRLASGVVRLTEGRPHLRTTHDYNSERPERDIKFPGVRHARLRGQALGPRAPTP